MMNDSFAANIYLIIFDTFYQQSAPAVVSIHTGNNISSSLVFKTLRNGYWNDFGREIEAVVTGKFRYDYTGCVLVSFDSTIIVI